MLETRMESINKKFDLDERLRDFAVEVFFFKESLPNSKAANHPGGQLLRSGTSPSLNYGEVRGAESQRDFIYKMKVCLKELGESYNNFRIRKKAKISFKLEEVEVLISGCNELISIFVASIHTASRKHS
jgi:four helix bundle protein